MKQENVAESSILFFVIFVFLFFLFYVIYIKKQKEYTVKIKQILKEKEHLDFLLQNSSEGYFVCEDNEDGSFVEIDVRFLAMTGYTKEELVCEYHNCFYKMILLEDLEKTKEKFRNQLQKEDSFYLEYRIFTKSKERIWVLDRGKRIRKRDGKNYLYHTIIDVSKEREIENIQNFQEERQEVVLKQSDHILFYFDRKEKRITIPKIYVDRYGYPEKLENVPDSLIEKEIIHPDSVFDVRKMMEELDKGEKIVSCECKICFPPKQDAWIKVTLIQISKENGWIEQEVGIWQNITEQKETALYYLQEQKNREAILGYATDNFQVNFSQNKIVQASETRLCQNEFIFHSFYEEMIWEIAEKQVYKEDVPAFLNCFLLEKIHDAFLKGKTELSVEYRKKNKDGEYKWMLGTIYLVRNMITQELTGFVRIQDIDEQKKKELSWKFQAERDSLSGFYNKKMTETVLTRFFTMAESKQTHGLLIIDIDNFKVINDNYGHMFGDHVIEKMAECIRKCIRSSDIVGRIGGDEFMILLKEIPDASFAGKKADEICQFLGEISLKEITFPVSISVSIGIAVYPFHGQTFKQLYHNADCALYLSKKKGKNTYTFYEGV